MELVLNQGKPYGLLRTITGRNMVNTVLVAKEPFHAGEGGYSPYIIFDAGHLIRLC